ncbi:MAG: hypothetical protein RIR90_1502 [Bacteroidota bacterium]|jgi:hypothetical protein
MFGRFSLLLCLLVFGAATKAQISTKQLNGEWQLSDLQGKQISEIEKKKRYKFTTDSLHYSSAKVQLSGAIQLNSEKGICYWTIPGKATPIVFFLQLQADGSLLLWEEGKDDVKGVLKRITTIQ